MNKDIEQIKIQLEELNRKFSLLSSNTTIPLEIGEAFRKRLKPVAGDTNATSPSTYTQAVNEAGASTYNVAKVMTGFITIEVNGNSYNVPYY